MRRRRVACGVALTALLVVAGSPPAGAAVSLQTEPVAGQGAGGVEVGTAVLTRAPHTLGVSLTMSTPASGSYAYPEGAADAGGPEVFSLWAFVFADPSKCGDDGCAGLADVAASGGGVFNVAGHPAGGETLQLSGTITHHTTPFRENQLSVAAIPGAEVHLAVAPHGTLDPEQMPEQATLPIGSPDFWWIAVFE